MVCPSFQIRQCHKKSKDILKDRVSELPDNILGHILSLSPTKDVMQTSVLSKRWRNVWTSVLTVDINDRSISNDSVDNLDTQFMNFVDKVLFGLNKSSLRIFRLKLSERYNMSRVREWINVVTMLNDLEEFELEYYPYVDYFFELPSCIFTLKKLVKLTLSATVVISYPSSFFLPSLKTLVLHSIPLLNIDSLNTLLIGCPLLEEFSLYSEWVDHTSGSTLCVKSPTMKSFKLSEGEIPVYPLSRVVIDANNLEELVLKVPLTLHIELSTKHSSLVNVKLDIHNNGYVEAFDEADMNYLNFLELLKKIPNTKYLFLSSYAMEALEHGPCYNVPLFKNLINLEGCVYKANWAIFQCLFKSSPNLVSLSFKEGSTRVVQWRTLGPPNLSMQHLEDIKLIVFEGTEDDIEYVTFFLKIAPVLKIITIEYIYVVGVSNFQTKILELRKAYPACKIEIQVWDGDLVI